MKRLVSLVIAPVLFVAPILFGVQPASAASRPSVVKVPGTYKLYYKWNQTKFGHSPITLKANHTGSDVDGNAISWSRSGESIMFVLDAQATQGATATYVGVVTVTGLCAKTSHCHMQNNVGASGEWYAEKLS